MVNFWIWFHVSLASKAVKKEFNLEDYTAINKGKVTGDVIQILGCGAQGYLVNNGNVLGGVAQNNIDCEVAEC